MNFSKRLALFAAMALSGNALRMDGTNGLTVKGRTNYDGIYDGKIVLISSKTEIKKMADPLFRAVEQEVNQHKNINTINGPVLALQQQAHKFEVFTPNTVHSHMATIHFRPDGAPIGTQLTDADVLRIHAECGACQKLNKPCFACAPKLQAIGINALVSQFDAIRQGFERGSAQELCQDDDGLFDTYQNDFHDSRVIKSLLPSNERILDRYEDDYDDPLFMLQDCFGYVQQELPARVIVQHFINIRQSMLILISQYANYPAENAILLSPPVHQLQEVLQRFEAALRGASSPPTDEQLVTIGGTLGEIDVFLQNSDVDEAQTDGEEDDGSDGEDDQDDAMPMAQPAAMAHPLFGHVNVHDHAGHAMQGTKRGSDEMQDFHHSGSSDVPPAQRLRMTEQEGVLQQAAHTEQDDVCDASDEDSVGEIDLHEHFGDQAYKHLLDDESPEAIMRQVSGGI